MYRVVVVASRLDGATNITDDQVSGAAVNGDEHRLMRAACAVPRRLVVNATSIHRSKSVRTPETPLHCFELVPDRYGVASSANPAARSGKSPGDVNAAGRGEKRALKELRPRRRAYRAV